MAKIHKEKILQNLDKYRVYIEDTDPGSRYFQIRDLPSIFHAGKNAIVLAGSENLVDDTEVYVEILDENGDPVFSQPIKNYAEGRARVVSVEIYEDTPAGPGLLTILGHLATTEDGSPIPEQWRNVYNVRWQKRITIDPGTKNTSKIRLYDEPTLDVEEILFTFRKSITGSVNEVVPTGGALALGSQAKFRPDDYLIRFVGTPPTYVSQSFVSGTFTVPQSAITCAVTGDYSATIKEIVNSTTMYVSPPLLNTSGNVCFGTFADYTMSFKEETLFTETTLTRSFANCRINNLRTFSGQISRTKIFYRSVDQELGFEFLADQILTAPELTQTQSFVLGPDTQMGVFYTSSVVTEFWKNGDVVLMPDNRPAQIPYSESITLDLEWNTDRFIDSIHLAGFNLEDTGSTIPLKYFNLNHNMGFLEQSEYEFSFNYLCRKRKDIDAKMEVYLTGSAFPNQTNPLGTLLATYEIPAETTNFSSDYATALRNNNSVVFLSPRSGSAQLHFVIYGGDWYINNVILKSGVERGFNADYSKFISPVTGRRYEQLQFKAQLFDPDNNEYPQEIISDVVFFDGGNLLLRGPDHRLEGKFTVSPSGSGATLSSLGWLDTDGTPVSPGTAIYIGEGQWFTKRTPFLVAATPDEAFPPNDPKISIANKLRGYMIYEGQRADGTAITYDNPEFILEIYGTLIIGGENGTRQFQYYFPRGNSDKWFHRIRGINLDFWDLQGKKAITAGEIDTSTFSAFENSPQIARMGKYTRGEGGRVVPPENPKLLPPISATINPFSQATVTQSIATSGTIAIPSNLMFYNNTVYGNVEVYLSDSILAAASSSYYRVYAELIADTSWVGYETGSNPGTTYDPDFTGTRNRQTMAVNESIWITEAGDYSPVAYFDYPIHIPEYRPPGANLLYVTIRLIIISTTEATALDLPVELSGIVAEQTENWQVTGSYMIIA